MNKNVEIDTEKLEESIKKLKQQLTEYEKKINAFFKKLELGNPGDAWQGNTANLYSKLALESKEDYLDYGRQIKEIVNQLDSFKLDIENQVKENEDTCENGQDTYVWYY